MTLVKREDEFSLQVTVTDSPRFFIRIDRPSVGSRVFSFSDFFLFDGEDEQAVEAIELVARWANFPRSHYRLIFKDILPRRDELLEKKELVRRHDQIVAIVRRFAARNGLTVENALLSPAHGRMETIVDVSAKNSGRSTVGNGPNVTEFPGRK